MELSLDVQDLHKLPDIKIHKLSKQIALDYERNILMFAVEFKTLRVYAVSWTSVVRHTDGTCIGLDCNYELFSFENRAEAFKLAKKHDGGTVTIHNMSRLAKMPDEVFHNLPSSENLPVVEIFRDTFKEFRCIGNEPK